MTYRDPREPYEAVPVWPVREEREAVNAVWRLLRKGSLRARGEICELLARDDQFWVVWRLCGSAVADAPWGATR